MGSYTSLSRLGPAQWDIFLVFKMNGEIQEFLYPCKWNNVNLSLLMHIDSKIFISDTRQQFVTKDRLITTFSLTKLKREACWSAG